MPIIHTTHDIKAGALVRIQISLGRADLMRRRQAQMPIPAPVSATALIDPGPNALASSPDSSPRSVCRSAWVA